LGERDIVAGPGEDGVARDPEVYGCRGSFAWRGYEGGADVAVQNAEVVEEVAGGEIEVSL
jgi:hypothetical protein